MEVQFPSFPLNTLHAGGHKTQPAMMNDALYRNTTLTYLDLEDASCSGVNCQWSMALTLAPCLINNSVTS